MTSQQNSASISLKTIFLILFQSRLCFIYKVLLLIFGLSTSFSLLVNEAGMYNAQARHKAQVKMELAKRGSLQCVGACKAGLKSKCYVDQGGNLCK